MERRHSVLFSFFYFFGSYSDKTTGYEMIWKTAKHGSAFGKKNFGKTGCLLHHISKKIPGSLVYFRPRLSLKYRLLKLLGLVLNWQERQECDWNKKYLSPLGCMVGWANKDLRLFYPRDLALKSSDPYLPNLVLTKELLLAQRHVLLPFW